MLGLTLAALLAVQDGGKLAWKGKDPSTPAEAFLGARREGKKLLLFFSSKGSEPCTQLSAGAFSDPQVVEASRKLTCIFVDCAWGKKNVEFIQQYGVRNYPTVLFCEPDGRLLETLKHRDVAGVVAQIDAVTGGAAAPAAPAVAPPPPFPPLTTQSLAQARAAKKPLAIYFYDGSAASQTVHQAFADEQVKPVLDSFLWVRKELGRGMDAGGFGVDRTPCVVVLDVALESPLEKPKAKIQGSRSPRELRRELDLALGRPVAEAAAEERKGGEFVLPKAEDLSDDEVDRQFILASVGVAREWIRKGKKDAAAGILEDIVKSYPKHRATLEARKLLEEIRK
jgi:hypothetical protein